MKNNSKTLRLRGGCHCENIQTFLDWPDPQEKIQVRACSCTLCRKHGAVWTSNPSGGFGLTIKDQNKVSFYRFGTETADFCLCAICGVLPIATCDIKNVTYSVLNANTFTNIDPTRFFSVSTNFDGEDTDSRLVRRLRNWTPQQNSQS